MSYTYIYICIYIYIYAGAFFGERFFLQFCNVYIDYIEYINIVYIYICICTSRKEHMYIYIYTHIFQFCFISSIYCMYCPGEYGH